MSQIINIGQVYSPLSPSPGLAARPTPVRSKAEAFEGDAIEFSGPALAWAVEQSSLALAKTAAIRAEIESGTYETHERIAVTVVRLLDVIG